MSGADTWMPVYIGDYLRDTGHLTSGEHGGYFLMLMHAWTQGGALPNDDLRLRMIAKMDQKEWKVSGRTLTAFFRVEGDTLRHKRLDHELTKARSMTEQRRDAGKASAKAREAARKGNGNPTGVGTKLPTNDQQTGRPSPSPSPSDKDSNPPKPPRGPKSMEGDPECLAFYRAYPRHEAPDDCFKAWRQVIAAGADPGDIMAGLARYRFNPDPTYIKHPASWLRAGAWKSEPPPKTVEQLSLVSPSNPTGRTVVPMTGTW